jgi:hypothetical protein
VTSPDTTVPVMTPEPLAIRRLPAVELASFEWAIPAEAERLELSRLPLTTAMIALSLSATSAEVVGVGRRAAGDRKGDEAQAVALSTEGMRCSRRWWARRETVQDCPTLKKWVEKVVPLTAVRPKGGREGRGGAPEARAPEGAAPGHGVFLGQGQRVFESGEGLKSFEIAR